MDRFRWESPGFGLDTELSDRVEIFTLRKRELLLQEDWPQNLSSTIADRKMLDAHDSQVMLGFFLTLRVGEPARCHFPPWGLACRSGGRRTGGRRSGGRVKFAATICFECNNAYVFRGEERNLRAFDPHLAPAPALLAMLRRELPLG